MSLLQTENEILQAFKELAIAQLPDKTRANWNPLVYTVKGEHLDFELSEIETQEIIVKDYGYGQVSGDYIYSLSMSFKGVPYVATIRTRYDSGSCEVCDKVRYANSESYQDEDNIVDPRDFMIEEINGLKFSTIRKI